MPTAALTYGQRWLFKSGDVLASDPLRNGSQIPLKVISPDLPATTDLGYANQRRFCISPFRTGAPRDRNC
jgi:hypothetical protein